MEDRRTFIKTLTFYATLIMFVFSPFRLINLYKGSIKLSDRELSLIKNSGRIMKKKTKELKFWDYVVVMDHEYKPLFCLNDTGYWIWRQIDGRRGFLEILKMMTDLYEVEKKRASFDLINLLGQLWRKSLVNFN